MHSNSNTGAGGGTPPPPKPNPNQRKFILSAGSTGMSTTGGAGGGGGGILKPNALTTISGPSLLTSTPRSSNTSNMPLPLASSTLRSGAGVGVGKPLASSTALEEQGAPKGCTHESHLALHTELSTEHYQQQLESFREQAVLSGGDTAMINTQLNEIFVKRLQDIDCSAEGDTDLKLITYQEWVDMLLKINQDIISNMEDLESEVAERLELMQRKVAANNCRHSQGNELAKCRKDISTLLKVIQKAYHCNSWNMQGLCFETLTHQQVLGFSNERLPAGVDAEGSNMTSMANESALQNKLVSNMKALAVEVASKHDEICDLKKQIGCMEDEIQKAQKKIQLKDDVIKELRNDLKCANSKLSNRSLPSIRMPPVNMETQHSSRSATTQVSETLESNPMLYINDDGSQFESLSNNEHLEQQKLKVLEEELNELFEMTKDLKKQNLEYHRKRLSGIFQKSEAEKAEAYRKLDFIRRQLIDLEATSAESSVTIVNDCDSGFSSKSEHDQDAKILEAVRKRLRKLNECSFDLKKRVQKLEIENSELSTSLNTEKCFSQHNSKTLKEVADLLCGMSGQQFSYNDIYSSKCQQNPFVETILKLKNTYQTREEQLLCNLTNKTKQIQEMEESLFDNTAISQFRTNTTDITTATTTTTTTKTLQQDTPPTPPPPPATTTTTPPQHRQLAAPAPSRLTSQQLKPSETNPKPQPVDNPLNRQSQRQSHRDSDHDFDTAWNW